MALAERKRRNQSSQFAIDAQHVVELVCGALAWSDNASARLRQTTARAQLHDFSRQQGITQTDRRRSKQRRHILRTHGRTRRHIYDQRFRLQQFEIAARHARNHVAFANNGPESKRNAITSYRFGFSRGFGDGDWRTATPPVRLTNLPEASKTE